MGCCFSQIEGTGPVEEPPQPQPKREAPTKNYSKPKWKHEQGPLTAARLQAMRDEYWDTQPAYGGDKVIWDAIKAAVESEDMATARLILETAGVIVAKSDMTVMYDERGARYVLPKYVLSPPSNLVKGDEQEVQLQPRSQAA